MQKELKEITHVTHAKARVPCLNQLYQSFSGKISKRKYAKYCPPLMLRK